MEKEIKGLKIGVYNRGSLNSITDVEGVKVGHITLDEDSIKTGVTAIVPAKGNLFENKLVAATHVFNGYGKSVGLVQIEELGTLETPILLTNTLSIGAVLEGLVQYKIERNPQIGKKYGTVNGVVCECNDGYLNDIRTLAVKPKHALDAIACAGYKCEQGAIGAGKGMSSYQLKGGIGTSSRVVNIGENKYKVGILVLANMGRLDSLLVDGEKVGAFIENKQKEASKGAQNILEKDKGSIIMIVATDAPVSSRQLKRICRRTSVGLCRTGSYLGHGSGDIAIGFSTAYRIPHEGIFDVARRNVHESQLDCFFEATGEATEEAILNGLFNAVSTEGRDGNRRESLSQWFEKWELKKFHEKKGNKP